MRGWGSGFKTEAQPGSVEVRFLGVWDIVAAFGLVIGGLQKTNPGFTLNLPTEHVVRHGAHAMALDGRRYACAKGGLAVHGGGSPDERVGNFRETWFRGVHGNVGGSGQLGSVTFCWMVGHAGAAGVKLDWSGLSTVNPVPNTQIGSNLNPRIERPRKIWKDDWVHQVAKDWTGPIEDVGAGESWKRLFTFKWKSPRAGRSVHDDVQIDTAPVDCS